MVIFFRHGENSKMSELDLRNIPCPQNASKALIYLFGVESDELITILLDDGEPIDNVPTTLENEGHTIVEKKMIDNSYWLLVVKAA